MFAEPVFKVALSFSLFYPKKEKYPEAYERRGKDIFKFKFGQNSENFYDLKYRAVKTLKKILEEDDARDIFIVAHKGVIQMIAGALAGRPVEDRWPDLANGEYIILQVDETIMI